MLDNRCTRIAAIVVHDGSILLISRSSNGRAYYTLPGGRLEKDESSRAACVREVYEETSIQVKAERLVLKVEWTDGHFHLYYLCTYVSGQPALLANTNEAKSMMAQNGTESYCPVWFDINQLDRIKMFPSPLKKVVRSCIADPTRRYEVLHLDIKLKQMSL